ncbi:MAG: hypothetical protein F4106_01790 [Gemmatimonadetes bacterium]|nr:hypothetical protein [Gemmatimonadota bacterium]MXX70282.1 hypothetical protein [Gemmatimonadota bacterium]MYC91944.1 hypothetical protein [Gemmatimonadota bacterium]MYJ16779.1 hypothetical protein [Gemmatimonadota bacterium]
MRQPRTVVPDDVFRPLNEFELKAAPGKLFLHQGWEAIRLGRPVLFPKRSLARQSPGCADEMIRYGAFGFDARTLPLVLDDLPSRRGREQLPGSQRDDLRVHPPGNDAD